MGFVLKPHGFNGKLRIAIEDEDYDPAGFLLISVNDKFVPFAIEEFNEKAALVKLHGIDTLERAEELAGHSILELAADGQDEPQGLEGYTITDRNSGQTFDVTGISYLPNNTLIEFRNGYKDSLIPLHEDLIVEIDHENRTILADFPDGILDL